MIDLRCGDCCELTPTLESESQECIITSPPYFRKIDYQNGDNQIGLEQTPCEYVERLGLVYGECYRVLSEGGTLWIVINDTYNNSAPLRKSLAERKNNQTVPFHTRRKLMNGYREKELLGIPFLLKDELRRHGFIWRSTSIWHKPTYGYDSGEDRPTINHEYILQFVKAKGRGRPYANIGRINESVWTIEPESYEGHPCPFPVELAARIIRALPKGARVFDPMAGSGSTLIAALELGYDATGFEINAGYVELIRKRIAEAQMQLALPCLTSNA